MPPAFHAWIHALSSSKSSRGSESSKIFTAAARWGTSLLKNSKKGSKASPMINSSNAAWMMPVATYFSTRVSGSKSSRRCLTAKSSKSLSVRETTFSHIATMSSLNARDFHMAINTGLRIRSIGLTWLPFKRSSVVSWQKFQTISTKRKASQWQMWSRPSSWLGVPRF